MGGRGGGEVRYDVKGVGGRAMELRVENRIEYIISLAFGEGKGGRSSEVEANPPGNDATGHRDVFLEKDNKVLKLQRNECVKHAHFRNRNGKKVLG